MIAARSDPNAMITSPGSFPLFRKLRRLSARLAGAVLALGPTVVLACPEAARPRPPLAADIRARATAEKRPFSILAIGSSTTAGVGASRPERTFPAQLAGRLVQAWGAGSVEVTNAGVSGESSPATLKRLEAFMAAEPRPDLVIWQVGTNDVIFFGSPENLGRSVGRGLDAIHAAGSAAIVIDQQFYPGIVNQKTYEGFVSAVGTAAAARAVPLLPRYAMMKQWAHDDPAGYRALLAWDNFHMSDAGYACLGQLLADAILAVDAPVQGRSAAPAPQGQANRIGAKKP